VTSSWFFILHLFQFNSLSASVILLLAAKLEQQSQHVVYCAVLRWIRRILDASHCRKDYSSLILARQRSEVTACSDSNCI